MKGILYTLMISLMLIPILALVIFYSQTSQIRDIDTDIRANELEYFSKSIERDLERFIEINGKRALISAVSKIVVNGTPLDDAQMRLGEMMVNGTLFGEPSPLVDESNLMFWQDRINEIADSSGFIVDFENIQIYINQSDSFNLMFNVNISINISDKLEVMGVLKNISTSVPVSIEGVEDPMFPLNTYGRVVRFIRQSNVSKQTQYYAQGANASGFVTGEAFVIDSTQLTSSFSDKILVTDSISGKEAIASGFLGVVSEGDINIPSGILGKAITGATGAMASVINGSTIYLDETTRKVWDLGNLTMDIKSGFYHESSSGASFLDRLEGNTMLTPEYGYGLETFVYLPDITNSGVSIDNSASCVDYRYWNGIAGSAIRNNDYDPIYSWFKMDSSSAADYGIDELV
ncbi:MAG: hypothetical protein JW700_03510 [Candidatus Aenigmarchaeota archaeon]|nr:hypothetical protein [Candidatus Aenigmarchaeota archaeon]